MLSLPKNLSCENYKAYKGVYDTRLKGCRPVFPGDTEVQDPDRRRRGRTMRENKTRGYGGKEKAYTS